MSEAELDGGVRRILASLPLAGYHTYDSRHSAAGFPDWVFAGAGGVLWRELKAERGKVSALQQVWLDVLASSGQNTGIWRPSDLLSGRIARELAAIAFPPAPAGTGGQQT